MEAYLQAILSAQQVDKLYLVINSSGRKRVTAKKNRTRTIIVPRPCIIISIPFSEVYSRDATFSAKLTCLRCIAGIPGCYTVYSQLLFIIYSVRVWAVYECMVCNSCQVVSLSLGSVRVWAVYECMPCATLAKWSLYCFSVTML